MRKALDSKHACAVNFDLQKAFGTVSHSILLDKLRYYGVRGQTNKWFENFITERYQYTSMKECSSFLGPLLFLLYIKDLHKPIEPSSAHHFADDTNILFINKSLKKINRCINRDLKLLCQWIQSNKLSLNAGKTEIIIFERKHQFKLQS